LQSWCLLALICQSSFTTNKGLGTLEECFNPLLIKRERLFEVGCLLTVDVVEQSDGVIDFEKLVDLHIGRLIRLICNKCAHAEVTIAFCTTWQLLQGLLDGRLLPKAI